MENRGVPYISDEAFPRGLVIGSHIPARKKNIDNYGGFSRPGEAAYTMDDCRTDEKKKNAVRSNMMRMA